MLSYWYHFSTFFQSCRSPHRTVQRSNHSDQAPWASLWRGTRVTWEHELGEFRWGLQGGSLLQNARKNFCAEIIFIVGCWNAMIHMKMCPNVRGNGNGDNYTWLADNYWWKYIYKLNTFWSWNNRFFPVYYLNCIKKRYIKLFKDTFVYHWQFLISRVTVKTFKHHLESSIYSAEN